MKKIIYKISSLFFSVILICSFVCIHKVYAHHGMAIDIAYACVDNNTYTVTLDFYFDCGSTVLDTPPDSPEIQIVSSSCAKMLWLTLDMLPNTGEEVSQICTAELQAGNTNCEQGNLPGVRRYTYVGQITLPQECPDWVFSYVMPEGTTRSATISNLQAPELYQIYVEATLNNTLGCNNSPTFATLPVAYFCTQPSVFSQSVIEEDGDLLVFSSIQPLDNVNTPIPYLGGYSLSQPIDVLGSAYSFSTTNGSFSFTPDGAQIDVVAVLVEEFRNGERIGSTIRDMQIIILDCENQQPSLDIPPQQSLYFCPNVPISLNITATDPDTDNTLNWIWNESQFPNATLSITGDNPSGATWSWLPTAADAGWHSLVLTATDEECPISMQQTATYNIFITEAPDAGSDRTYCPEGGALLITVTGGSSFDWSPAAGLVFLNPQHSIVQISPDSPQTYTITNECGAQDQLFIDIATGFPLAISPASPIGICQGEAFELQAIVPTTSSYSFVWQPAESLSNPFSATPLAYPTETTTYTLTATDNTTGCQVSEQFTVNVQPAVAQVSATAANASLCLGDSTQLFSNIALQQLLSCGANNEVCNSNVGSVTHQIGDGTTTDNNTSPYNVFYKKTRIQMLYTAAELQNLGIASGIITGIGFDIATKYSSIPYDNFHIKIGCTELSSLSGFLPNLDEVYSSNNYSTVVGLNNHILNTTYSWDGVSNLVVEVCNTNAQTNIFDVVRSTPTSFESVVVAETDNPAQPAGCLLASGESSLNRPNLYLTYCLPPPPAIPLTWSPATGLSQTQISNPIAKPEHTTTYTVTYDNGGCVGAANVTVYVAETKTGFARFDTTICAPQAVQLYLTSNFSPESTYQWQPIAGLSNPTDANPIATVSQTTTYVVTVNHNDGCNTVSSDSVTVALNNVELPQVEYEICAGDFAVMENIPQASSYFWEPAYGLSCTTCGSPQMAPETTTTYTVSLNNSGGGCPAVLSVLVKVLPKPIISIEAPAFVLRGEVVQLSAIGNFSNIIWTPSEGLDFPNSPTPNATINATTTYTATATDAETGCEVSASVVLNYLGCETLLVPTAFSPNGDNINDRWQPVALSYDEILRLEVFDRWGKLRYSYQKGGNNPSYWDGTDKGTLAEIGVYVYYVEAVCSEKILTQKGNFTLIR